MGRALELGCPRSPPTPHLNKILQYIAKKESIKLPIELADSIAQKSNRNLRRAILMFEACRVQSHTMTATTEVQLCDWEVYIEATAKQVRMGEQPLLWSDP